MIDVKTSAPTRRQNIREFNPFPRCCETPTPCDMLGVIPLPSTSSDQSYRKGWRVCNISPQSKFM